MYEKYIKRILDIICALVAIILLSWLYAIIAILVKAKLGSPVIFVQPRPGKKDKNCNEKIFKLYKFRTMLDARDEEGNYLPDEVRLTKFGAMLRSLSLDELPELWNVLRGDMSIIGPRPLLVRDMVFMSSEQRKRHDVRPGLSGLAQISGRNAIPWEGKLAADLEYIKHVTFWGDLKIFLKTIVIVLRREGITEEGMATAEDLGDYLLRNGKVSITEYNDKQAESKEILKQRGCN